MRVTSPPQIAAPEPLHHRRLDVLRSRRANCGPDTAHRALAVNGYGSKISCSSGCPSAALDFARRRDDVARRPGAELVEPPRLRVADHRVEDLGVHGSIEQIDAEHVGRLDPKRFRERGQIRNGL